MPHRPNLFAATAASAFLLASTLAQAAGPSYITPSPLATKLSASPRDCGAMPTWRMPIITWGADEVTLFANGGLKTAPHSAIGERGLSIQLKRVDDFVDQVKAYESCESPFLRATLGMIAQAADVTEADPRTRVVVIDQLSWSSGGDTIVARPGIRGIKDLKGKTIVLQQFGPHVDYLLKLLDGAGLKPSDVTLRFVKDLTGKSDDTPMHAMASDPSVDAVMVISTDAATLTSGMGSVGTGAEASVKGAHTILSTRSANRIITDVIAVRRDFYDAHKAELSAFGKAMYDAGERLSADFAAKNAEWKASLKTSAAELLDDPEASADAEGLWTDAEIANRQEDARFFADPKYRGFETIATEAQNNMKAAGLVNGLHRLASADWDWGAQTSIVNVTAAPAPAFNPGAASRAVSNIAAENKGDDNTLFAFGIHFKNGQKDFPISLYGEDFDRVIDLSQTLAGAVITVTGHADPQAYLNVAEKAGPSGTASLVLKQSAQAGKNLSLQRAQAARDAVIAAAKDKGVTLDPTQFVTIGLGYDQPVGGMCGALPCRPKNEQEAAANRVVDFHVLNVEAETDAFASPSK